MKGIVLAGGSGTRLHPLTATTTKQLLPVANRPILFYVLDDLVAAGITELAIVVAPATGAEVRLRVGDGSRWGAKITYIVQDRPAGIAHAVLAARDFVGDDAFCVFLGDCLLGRGVREAASTFQSSPALDALVMLKEVDDPHGFGVAVLDDRDDVVQLVEKPAEPPSRLAIVGVYFLRPGVFDAIGAIAPSPRGELELTDALSKLVERKARVGGHRLEGWWVDAGSRERLLLANERVLDDRLVPAIEGEVSADSTLSGAIRVETGARVLRSTLVGPLVVGRDARIEDSRVGPFTSIGDGCTVVRSSVERAILFDGVHVDGVMGLERRILGRSGRLDG